MLLEFKHRENEHTIAVDEKDGKFIITIDSQPIEIDAVEVSPGCINILSSGRSHTAHVASSGGSVLLQVDGVKYKVDEIVEGEDTGGGSIVSELAASGVLIMPMPGKVIKVNICEGDAVVAGQTLVVIESMKMEQNIKTVVAGIVRKVCITEGEQVDLEKTLVEVEPEIKTEK